MACKKWSSRITKLLALGLSVTFLFQQAPVVHATETDTGAPQEQGQTLNTPEAGRSATGGENQSTGTGGDVSGNTSLSGNKSGNNDTNGTISGNDGNNDANPNTNAGGNTDGNTDQNPPATTPADQPLSGGGTGDQDGNSAGDTQNNTPVNEGNSAATGGSNYARTEEAEGALNKLNNAEPVNAETGITLLPDADVKLFHDRNNPDISVRALYCPPDIKAENGWANTLSLWFEGGWIEAQYKFTDAFGTMVVPTWTTVIDGREVTVDDTNYKELKAKSVVTAKFPVKTLFIQASTGGQFGASSEYDKLLKDGNGGYTAQVTPQVVSDSEFTLNKQAILDKYVDQANYKALVEKMYGTGVNLSVDLYADPAATEPLADGAILDLSKPLIVRHRATADVRVELGEGGAFPDLNEDCIAVRPVEGESGTYLLTFLVGQGKKIPAARKNGVSLASYTNKADNSLIEDGKITVRAGMTLIANWKSAYTAEFVLYDHKKEGAGAAFDPAILTSPLSGVGSKSSLLAFQNTTIDGAINLSQGQKIGDAFSQTVVSGFTQAPSLDPIPADGYRAVFEGWVLSTEPNKIYSSDELSRKILTQSVLISAKWTDDQTKVAKVVFRADADTVKITNGLRRTQVTGGDVAVYVRRGEDQRDRFTVSGIPQIRAVSRERDGKATYDFNGWKEKDGKATGWTFTEDETVLTPVWIQPGEVGVTGVLINDLTSRTVKLNLHEKKSFSATIQGKVASNDAMPAMAWVVKEEYNETLGVWQPLTDTNKSTILSYTAEAVAKNRIAQDPVTDKKKAATWSVTGDRGGKARVEVRVTGAGGTVYSDLVIVEVVVPVKTIAFADGKEHPSIVASSVNGTPISLLLSSDTKGVVPSQRRIYITSGKEDDDFYDIYGWETETITNTDGSTIGRKYVTAGGSDGVASFYIRPNDKNLAGDPWMHAGSTRLIFTTEGNQ
ncbi:MAG: hypothetical protein II800_02750, partial [Lachnospiraceae bacterium]|nr:hypothetical protein [Lachnospiraceae bacterium]